jgi:hypothetical protein
VAPGEYGYLDFGMQTVHFKVPPELSAAANTPIKPSGSW